MRKISAVWILALSASTSSAPVTTPPPDGNIVFYNHADPSIDAAKVLEIRCHQSFCAGDRISRPNPVALYVLS